MTDIELVIKISEEDFEIMKHNIKVGNPLCPISQEKMVDIVAHGIPLAKGHGDLVTKEQIIDLVEFYQMNPQHFDFVNLIDEIRDEKPIVEADRSEEECRLMKQ